LTPESRLPGSVYDILLYTSAVNCLGHFRTIEPPGVTRRPYSLKPCIASVQHQHQGKTAIVSPRNASSRFSRSSRRRCRATPGVESVSHRLPLLRLIHKSSVLVESTKGPSKSSSPRVARVEGGDCALFLHHFAIHPASNAWPDDPTLG
jgi:hypothetical protein